MKNSISKIRSIICLSAVTLVTSALHGQVEDLPKLPIPEPALDTFNLATPVPVTDVNKQSIFLKGMNEGRLILTFPNMPDASAEIPMDAKNVQLTLELPKNFNAMNTQAANGKYLPMYNGMKDTAGSLLRFLKFPQSKCNFHNICLRYYDAAVKQGPLKEVVALTMQMPWEFLPEDFVLHAESLVFRCIDEKDFESTQQLLGLLYTSMDEEEFAEMAFRVADTLRTAGQHAITAEIYGSIAQTEDLVLRQKSLLWACYSSAVAGDSESARKLLEGIDPLKREDENFLTYCLARGRVGLADGNTREGLRYLSRAMVLTTVEATFKAELYYLLIYCYNESGEEDAAQRLVREFEIFYPTNPWLKKYQTENGA